MNLDMWFKDDIRNVLLGLAQAEPNMGYDRPDGGADFRDGYRAAMNAVAASFGIQDWPHYGPRVRVIEQQARLANGRSVPRLTGGRR